MGAITRLRTAADVELDLDQLLLQVADDIAKEARVRVATALRGHGLKVTPASVRMMAFGLTLSAAEKLCGAKAGDPGFNLALSRGIALLIQEFKK